MILFNVRYWLLWLHIIKLEIRIIGITIFIVSNLAFFCSLVLSAFDYGHGLLIRAIEFGATLWARARGIALAVAFISARTGWGLKL
jgi:hypothetical protein